MNVVTPEMDAEIAVYKIMGKVQKAGLRETLSSFSSKVINLYMKRFGKKDHVDTLSDEEFMKEFLDCFENLANRDEDGKKIFEIFTDELEINYIAAMISNLMRN